MIDRTAIMKEILAWADKYGYHMIATTANLPLFERLLDDAIKLSKGESEYAVLMALIVEQQRTLSLWSKVILKK